MSSQPLYALRIPEVYTDLQTSPEGLSSGDVSTRLELYGQNRLADPPVIPIWRRWLIFVTHPMALVLWAAGLAFLATRQIELGLVIWLVVLINGTFSFWREYQANRAVEALRKLLPVYARVIREGAEIKVPASEIVLGDLIILAEGDNIPADARVVEEYGLRTNNATLTGEAIPARKSAESSIREGLTEVERPNLIFAGTSVVSGTGRALVYATGSSTQFGRIANLTQQVKEPPSQLALQLGRITRRITITAVIIGAIVLLVGLTDVGMNLRQALILAIGIIVAAVPEGLMPTVTLTLAIAVQRLAQHGVLVKKMSALETLGATSVICTDKSGTLTQNQMTVRQAWVAGTPLNVTGVGYEPKGKIQPAAKGATLPSQQDLRLFFAAASLCNNSRLTPPTPEHPQWTCLGDQTEAGLRVLALKGGVDEKELTLVYPRIHELPFDARRKRMSTIHRVPQGEIAFVKGAPKEVLQLCTHIQIGGETIPLTNALRANILETNDNFARSALRVLALAMHSMPPRTGMYTPEGVEQDLTFLGLAAMMDPPRPEVSAAMEVFRSAGIRMVMITGDYGLTAESLARRIGMISTKSPNIYTGADLDALGDVELQEILGEETIFARMAPEHKLRLVDAFQKRGDVVAVIGDGVNDAPALRKADIGIAMGITGTDVAKEAADVILMRDDFGSVVQAIEEGRSIFDNLRKFITYLFASNIPEILPFILTALFRIPLALTVTQILAIDLGTDLLPGLALGMEKPEPNVMQRCPRRRDQPLVDNHVILRAYVWLGMVEAVLCYLAFYLVYHSSIITISWFPLLGRWLSMFYFGNLPSRQLYIVATTVFHTGVVAAQVGNAFACRSESNTGRRLGWISNPYLLGAAGVEIILIAIMVYIQPIAQVFEHLPIPIVVFLALFIFAPVIYSLERLRRLLVQWVRKGLTARS